MFSEEDLNEGSKNYTYKEDTNNSHLNTRNNFSNGYDPIKDPYLLNEKSIFDPLTGNYFQQNGPFLNKSEGEHWEKRTGPQLEQFDRMFRALQSEFLRHAFFDAEDYENENEFFDPFSTFFSSPNKGEFPTPGDSENFHQDYPHHHRFNYSHGHTSFERDFNKDYFDASHAEHEKNKHFHPWKDNIHYSHKYVENEYDDKIYDV